MPDLYIITGSNGAGKSTVGPAYLPKHIQENHTVFDGDLLYTRKLNELFPIIVPSPKYARKEAFQYLLDLFDEQTENAITNYTDYVYEGHFINDETWKTPRKFKEAGYHIHLIFFGLDDPELSQLRVTDRVLEGGHYVDKATLEGNFYGNLEKLNIHHKLIDHLTIVDTSEIDHQVLFKTTNHNVDFCLEQQQLPNWFTEYLPALLALNH